LALIPKNHDPEALAMNYLRRVLPSLTALQFFDAAVRHMSFTRAAADLNVTQSGSSSGWC
jgi:hypothetical protein